MGSRCRSVNWGLQRQVEEDGSKSQATEAASVVSMPGGQERSLSWRMNCQKTGRMLRVGGCTGEFRGRSLNPGSCSHSSPAQPRPEHGVNLGGGEGDGDNEHPEKGVSQLELRTEAQRGRSVCLGHTWETSPDESITQRQKHQTEDAVHALFRNATLLQWGPKAALADNS